MWVCICTHLCKLRSLPAKTPPRNHTVQYQVREDKDPQEIIIAVLTESKEEGKTKSTGNTKRNVPWNWKLYMLTRCQVSACNWDLKVSTSMTALWLLLHLRHPSVNKSVFSWDGWIAPFWPLLHCENDRWIARCHVVPLKKPKAEQSAKAAHDFLRSQEHLFKGVWSGLLAKHVIS